MRKLFVFVLLGFTGMIFAACVQSNDETENDTLTIYTTIYPIQYAVGRVGGDLVDSQSVYPPGVDAHTYEPTTKEMTSIARGDAFIFLGAGMEGFADSASDTLASTDVKRVEIGRHNELFDTDTENDSHGDEHDHGDVDPHIWLDPNRLIDVASYIKDALIDLDPKNEDAFTKNFKALQDDLEDLDDDFQKTLNQKHDKTVLVSHAAYGYWEKRYGIEQISINGLSSSEEPSQRDLTKIIEQAESEDIHYIIFEQNTSSHVSEIIQEHIEAEARTVHNLSVLTDEDIENDEDYLSLMEKNLQVLDGILD